jgi:RNA polymerase sigma-70 factor (ECF subfamily)
LPAPAGGLVARPIDQARADPGSALGRLLDAARQYLLLVANRELPADLRAKLGPSDLVQETLLRAHQHFGQFRGQSEDELLGWLRQILLNHLANVRQTYLDTEKRDVGREVGLLDVPRGEQVGPLTDPASGPASAAEGRERDDRLHQALGALPADHQAVIRWRTYDDLPFAEVGRRLGRSEEAARKLYARALERLGRLLEAGDDAGRSP